MERRSEKLEASRSRIRRMNHAFEILNEAWVKVRDDQYMPGATKIISLHILADAENYLINEGSGAYDA
jgi:hypothetical protein